MPGVGSRCSGPAKRSADIVDSRNSFRGVDTLVHQPSSLLRAQWQALVAEGGQRRPGRGPPGTACGMTYSDICDM